MTDPALPVNVIGPLIDDTPDDAIWDRKLMAPLSWALRLSVRLAGRLTAVRLSVVAFPVVVEPNGASSVIDEAFGTEL